MAIHSGNYYLSLDQMTDNAQYILDYLLNKGWTKNAICGMLGNMQRESTINPGIWQNLDSGNTSLGFGLVQWTPASKYFTWCDSNNLEYSAMDSNLKRILWELENGEQYYSTDSYPESFKEFTQSTKSVTYLASAFLHNYERAGVSAETERQENAQYWFEHLSDESSKNQEIINKAVEWAVGIANDDSHGYDQEDRWGLDYDCSSLVIQAYENGGCPVKTNGATYTGNMVSVFKECGFEDVTSQINLSTGEGLIPGDVLWVSGHTEMFKGDGNLVGAHINELGTVTGGQTGDQTGNEISVRSYYNYPWTTVLRLPASGTGGGGDTPDNRPSPPIKEKNKKGYRFFMIKNRSVM